MIQTSWDLFHPQNLRVNLSSCIENTPKTKTMIIDEMIDLLISGNNLGSAKREAIADAIFHREHEKSTGLERGVALPHGRTNVVDNFYLAIGIYPAGIDFTSLDMKLTRFVLCTISDFNHFNNTLLILAEIMRFFQNPANAEESLQCATSESFCSLLRDSIKLK